MKKRITFILLLFISFCSSYAIRDTLQSRNLRFIENKNQWNKKALFGADVEGGILFLEKKCLTFNLFNPKDVKHSHAHHNTHNELVKKAIKYHAYQVEFVNCNDAELIPSQKDYDYLNYFIGNDKNKWAANVSKFAFVEYKNLFTDINLKIYSQKNFLKYDFIISPNANPENIKLKYKYIDKISLTKGHLLIQTSVNQILELRPYSYQLVDGVEKEVECNYVLNKNIVSFEVGEYDKTIPLIIDPSLIFSTYTGSITDNWGFTATYDLLGNAYAGGIVQNSGYPVNFGAYQLTNAGLWDIGIIKYDSLGINRLFATYLGGLQCEIPHSLIVNSSNQLLILGTTGSSNFPVTPTAYDTSFNGGQNLNYDGVLAYPNGVDIYISKLSSGGNQLLASTFIGGSGNDGLNFRQYYDANMMNGNDSLYYNYGDGARGEIITDNSGNVYVGTCTFSTNFPVTLNSFQPVNHGKQEGIVFKLDYNLSNLIWSSYIGGSEDDAVYSIDNDTLNNIYVTGGTNSTNFTVTPNAYKTSYQGGTADAFVTHISQNGNNIISSTYFGSPEYDQAYFVRVNRKGEIHIYGQTKADSNLLIYNALYNVPNSGQFITKFKNSLDSLIWSTVFGTGDGKPNISPTAFAVDICNRVYLSGWGRYWGGYTIGAESWPWGTVFGTVNMAVTPNAYQTTTDGQDFYILAISDDANSLQFASYFGEIHTGTDYSGHDHVDGGTSRFDKKGNVYQSVCASCGGYDAFPTYPSNVWSTLNQSPNCNNAVFKYNIYSDFALADFVDPPIICAPDTIFFQNSSLGTSFIWDFGDGSPLSTAVNPIHFYTQSGIYNVKLIANMLNGCVFSDTITKQLVVLSDSSYSIPDVSICVGTSKQIGINPIPFPTITYTWSPSIGLSDITISNPIANPLVTTTYKLLVFNGICTDTISQKVKVINLIVDAGNDTIVCNDTIKLTAHTTENPVQYIWSSNPNFTDTLNTSLNNNFANVHITSNSYFWVKIKNQLCEGIDSVKVDFAFTVNPITVVNPTCHDTCNGSINVNISGGTPPYSYQWNTGETTQTISNLCAGNYTVIVKDSTNCKSVKSFVLTNPTPLLLNPIITHVPCTGICIGKINANASGSSPPYTYAWSNTQVNNPATNLCAGFYSVIVTDSKNCKAEDTATVLVQTVFNNVQVWADKDTIYKDLSTNLHATVIPNVSYLWFPSYGLNSTSIANPKATPLVTTTYYLTLTDQYGCEYKDSITIIVIDLLCGEPYIYIPNGFTPNNDFQNDVLFVRSNILDEMNMSIFDRWGEKVFETSNINSGWDGKYKGEYCQPGVFVYYFKGRCLNEKYYEKKGNVTLIR